MRLHYAAAMPQRSTTAAQQLKGLSKNRSRVQSLCKSASRDTNLATSDRKTLGKYAEMPATRCPRWSRSTRNGKRKAQRHGKPTHSARRHPAARAARGEAGCTFLSKVFERWQAPVAGAASNGWRVTPRPRRQSVWWRARATPAPARTDGDLGFRDRRRHSWWGPPLLNNRPSRHGADSAVAAVRWTRREALVDVDAPIGRRNH